jgi:hypothetical protein
VLRNRSRYFWFGVLLVVLMIFRPQGLWPRRQVQRAMDESPGDQSAIYEGVVDSGLTEDNITLGDHGIPRT